MSRSSFRFPRRRAISAIARPLAIAATLSLAALGSQAQTVVKDAWVRGTVPQQKATGLFGEITSTKGGKLVSASTPVAKVVEIHEMSMDGSVMKMRAIPSLELPAGKAVSLKPGGHHIMLMDLVQPIKDGDHVIVKLVVEGKDGQRETLDVHAMVRPLNAAAPKGAAKPAADMAGHKH